MSFLRYLIALLLVLAPVASAFGGGSSTYYVKEAADGGNDGGNGHDGSTEALAWATLSYALQHCDDASPIIIYVKDATDDEFSEPATIATDASCQSKAVTITGYGTTPGDYDNASLGDQVTLSIGGTAAGFQIDAATHTAGSVTWKNFDFAGLGADDAADTHVRFVDAGGAVQVSLAYTNCTVRRNASMSAAACGFFSATGNPAAPTRTFSVSGALFEDWGPGAHTTGWFSLAEWASVTFNDCAFTGSPTGGLKYVATLDGTINTLTVTDCISTVTHDDETGYGFEFGAGIENVSEILITGSTFADSLILFNDADEGPGLVYIHDNTIVADGDGIVLGIQVGDPTTAYGIVSIVGNTLTMTSEYSNDHPIGLYKGIPMAEVAFNAVLCGSDVEWPVLLKCDRSGFHHNVVTGRIPLALQGGTHGVINNTLVQKGDANRGTVELKHNGASGGEDVWPEYCIITDNIIDAGIHSGSECLIIVDDSGVWNPPVGMYRTRVDRNVYVAGADGLATIFGTDCPGITELRAAWVTHAASGTLDTNDLNSEQVNAVGFLDAASDDYRLLRDSPAFTDDPNYFNATRGAWNGGVGGNSRWWPKRRLGYSKDNGRE